MKLRPVHALAVALLALVLAAAAGTSYAAHQIGSAQIKNNSIKGKDIKDNQVTGKDVKDSSLTGADIQDGSLTAADLPASTCRAGSLPLGGVCLIKATRPLASLSAAINDCNSVGGQLPRFDLIKLLPTVGGLTQGVTWTMNDTGQYEWTSDWATDSSNIVEPISSDYSGNLLLHSPTDTIGYHCVVPAS